MKRTRLQTHFEGCWQHHLDCALSEIDRLRNAIEDLVEDEVISAGRARELHRMTADEQRELWRRRGES